MKKFKNAKLTTKMILSFCIVALLCIITGAVGIYSIINLNNQLDEMNSQMVVPLGEFIKFYDKDSNTSLMVRDVMLDPQNGEKYKATILDSQSRALEALTEYDKGIISAEAKKLMVELRAGTEKMYTEQIAIVDMVLDGVDINSATFYERFGIYEALERSNLELQEKIYTIKLGLAAELSIEAASIANLTMIISIVVAVVATILAVLIGVFLARMIGKPIKAIGVAANRIVETGELGFDMGVEHTKDEVGQLAAEISALMGTFHEYSQVLEGISKGDFTVRAKVRGEKDIMGNSMRNVLLNFNEMFAEMQQVSGQVGDASRQISDGSQALAQGATEQASAIEELSASIQEISEQTNSTAEMAHRSNEASKAEIEKARKGNEQMKKLVEAVNNINEASVNISQTIKVIDDIAFQTNILALNAAVEAARAGQHGKGFAVVAEEVKNLATNSSAAAQETNDMIANSMELAKAGAAIAEAMQASLEEIVSGITDAANMVDTISTSAEEQALAINQINQGIEQVSQVVQNNSATAEESASASEEMSSQAEVLSAMVKRFKLRSKEEMANARRMQAVGAATMSAPSALPPKAKAAPAKAAKEEISIDWDDDEEGESYNPGSFGKY